MTTPRDRRTFSPSCTVQEPICHSNRAQHQRFTTPPAKCMCGMWLSEEFLRGTDTPQVIESSVVGLCVLLTIARGFEAAANDRGTGKCVRPSHG